MLAQSEAWGKHPSRARPMTRHGRPRAYGRRGRSPRAPRGRAHGPSGVRGGGHERPARAQIRGDGCGPPPGLPHGAGRWILACARMCSRRRRVGAAGA